MYEEKIQSTVQELPDVIKKEVLDYTEYLLIKLRKNKITKNKLKFDWKGGLSDLKDRFSSVDLQHKSMEWR